MKKQFLNIYNKGVGGENLTYLFQLFPTSNSRYLTSDPDNIFQIRTKYNFFKNLFFPQL